MEVQLASRLSADDCLKRGLKSRRQSPLSVAGLRVETASGLWARFTADPGVGALPDTLAFECSPCATLISYCQALLDYTNMNGYRLPSVPVLIAFVRGIPIAHHDRATLAMAAYRAVFHSLPATPESPA